jgi:hypothetical protein
LDRRRPRGRRVHEEILVGNLDGPLPLEGKAAEATFWSLRIMQGLLGQRIRRTWRRCAMRSESDSVTPAEMRHERGVLTLAGGRSRRLGWRDQASRFS